MGDDIDPAVIKKTQEILGSVIKKPPLTDKSLKKPPFRFLHDIVINVIKSSGFLKGLYTPEELQPDNVKDKDSKIAFLQKAIDVLSIATNQPVHLKPNKVVAGHDPQKTNLFLQSLGIAAKNKVDSKEAVEKVLSERSQGSPTKPIKERRASVDKRSKEKAHSRSLTKTLEPAKKSSSSSQKETSKSKDGEKSKEKSKESKRDREKSRERSKHKTDESKKTSKEKSSRSKETAKLEEGNVDLNVNENVKVNGFSNIDDSEQQSPVKGEENVLPTSLMNGEAHEREQSEVEASENVSEKLHREKSHRTHSSRSSRPPSARSKRTKPSEENESNVVATPREPVIATSAAVMDNGPRFPDQSFENVLLPTLRPPTARPTSARPSSSRPAPPRIRIRHVVENEENSFRPATAKPVENVILDQGHQSEEEEEDAFVVVENEPTENLEVMSSKALPATTPEEDKGSLVKKLLETKKDLEGGSQHTPTKKVEIDKSQLSETARNRERDSASKELGQLRNFVQSLSKTAVPLGRMLDFLQEDLDSMKMEFKMWKEEHIQNLAALNKEQSTTETLLEPLRAQLDDLDQVVQNQLDANSALKSSIARNDERIQRMLSSVNHKS